MLNETITSKISSKCSHLSILSLNTSESTFNVLKATWYGLAEMYFKAAKQIFDGLSEIPTLIISSTCVSK